MKLRVIYQLFVVIGNESAAARLRDHETTRRRDYGIKTEVGSQIA